MRLSPIWLPFRSCPRDCQENILWRSLAFGPSSPQFGANNKSDPIPHRCENIYANYIHPIFCRFSTKSLVKIGARLGITLPHADHYISLNYVGKTCPEKWLPLHPHGRRGFRFQAHFFWLAKTRYLDCLGDFKFINGTKRKSVASALKGKGAIGLEFLADTYAPHAPESPAWET